MDGSARTNNKALNLREKYQCVVIDTAELRAWGAEWVVSFQTDCRLDAPVGNKDRDVLIEHMTKAEVMLSKGFYKHFGEQKDNLSPALEEGRQRALSGVRQTLSTCSTLERALDQKQVKPESVTGLYMHHRDEVGEGISVFLAELNSLVAHTENSALDRRARMIRSTVDELRDVNFRINLIAINASIESLAPRTKKPSTFAESPGEISKLVMR